MGLRREGRNGALMRGVGVGVQQAHRNGLDSGRSEVFQDPARRALIQRIADAAVAVEPLGDFAAERAVDERRWKDRADVVDVVANLAAHFERIAEPFRCDNRGCGALSLDYRIDDKGRAVNDVLCFPGISIVGLLQRDEAGFDRFRRIDWCR